MMISPRHTLPFSDPSLVKEIQELMECQNIDELRRLCRHLTVQFGYIDFLYGVRTKGSTPAEFVLSSYPKEWREHYLQQRYDNADPMLMHCVRSHLPLIWNADSLVNQTTHQMFEEISDFVMKTGLSIPIHGSNVQVAMLNLACDLQPSQLQQHLLSTLPLACLFSNYLHQAVMRLVLQAKPLPASARPLTARELECLKWAMLGKTAWETSRILSISTRTIVFHLENAKSKLNVHNTRQAIARAIELELLH